MKTSFPGNTFCISGPLDENPPVTNGFSSQEGRNTFFHDKLGWYLFMLKNKL